MARPPALDGAEIADVALEGSTLVFWLENVPGLAGVMAGPLRLHGVRDATSREPRHADDAFPLWAPLTVRRAVWGANRLQLDCLRPSGPGDADEPSYRIGFTAMSHALAGSLGRSLRAWTGFYPLRGDRRKRLSGAGTVPVAAINAAAGRPA